MSWPHAAKLRLLSAIRERLWLETARPEQLPPDGDWRVWYLRGGRGSGKSRTGAETLASYIRNSEPLAAGQASEWAIVAPTFGDAKSVCTEGPSGLLRALGGEGGLVSNWNRSEGVMYLHDGGKVFLDGADDGALRIQGKNLRGCWADEVGLWKDWDRAWNQSIQFAVRFEPGKIVATGTPKMGHGLVKHLTENTSVVETVMRTFDNAANLDKLAVEQLRALYEGTTLGRQELEGEFIEFLEGEILLRAHWRWYDPSLSFYSRRSDFDAERLPVKFQQVVHTWDTAFKDKTSSDYVAGQVWGIHGADRYLLRLFHAHAGYSATKTAIKEFAVWGRECWPAVPHRILIEAASNGPDILDELRREVEGLIPVKAKGDKLQRVWAASPALESGNCFLPGAPDPDLSGYNANLTPADVQAFVEECAMFRADMGHAHDDQPDAWAQMVNWTRQHTGSRAVLGIAQGTIPPQGRLAGVR